MANTPRLEGQALKLPQYGSKQIVFTPMDDFVLRVPAAMKCVLFGFIYPVILVAMSRTTLFQSCC